jgi:hypothetical protein
VGSKHPKDWIVQFLQKQVDLDGKKHMGKFTGSSDELNTLATWLSSLK